MKFKSYILTTSFLLVFIFSNTFASIDTSYCNKVFNINEKIKIVTDSIMLDYPFKDVSGKTIFLSDFRGKFVFIDLWYSGCGFCISANNALKEVHKKLKNENLVFISLSVDSNRDKWIASITKNAKPSKLNPWSGKYVPPKGTIALYTGGTGTNNEFIKKYVPNKSYPKLLFVSPTGELITDRPPRPDSFPKDKPERLISFLKEYLKSVK